MDFYWSFVWTSGALASNDALAKSGGPVDYTRYVKRYASHC